MKSVSVVIPIYLSTPNLDDLKSFNQCLSVLGNHPIYIICPKDLDISLYEKFASNYNIRCNIHRFSNSYFLNVQGYSRLMLSLEFYESFKNYEYILLYQLDAWVFRDELNVWCDMGYDYIGAPWFENFGTYNEGNKIWAVGNGGFSLRRIPAFINVINSSRNFYGLKELKKKYRYKDGLLYNLRVNIIVFLKLLGVRNNNKYIINSYSRNEDQFWALLLNSSNSKLKIPSADIAIAFAFEKSPSYLFQHNNNKLPFGCHAWRKHEYEFFWNKFIHVN